MVRYVAIIADGNRRWARKQGLPVETGHDAAADTLSARIRDAARLGVQELSVYVFSTENWTRSNGEISALMAMLTRRLARETPQLHRDGVRMRVLGDHSGVSDELAEQIERSQSLTAENTGLTLYMAINYGGRAEIAAAASLSAAGASQEEFARGLYAPEMHDPEVIIRTGGEHRLSNFLLWQSAYSELVFRDELWPDFTRDAFEESLAEFDARNRRFGGR
jgi:undecaprenyl diphosphate synthase